MTLNSRQYFFIKKLKDFIKSIFEWMLVRLLRFLNILKKKIQAYLKSPIKSISELWKPILFLGFCSIFAYCVLTDDIYIEDAEIQGSAKDHGFTGEMLTQQAIAIIPEEANQRINNLPNRFLQMYQHSSDQFEDDQLCNTNFLLGKQNLDFYLHVLNRVEMSSKMPDQFISSQSVSIKKLAFWVREKVGISPARQLQPLLWKEGERFFIKLSATPFITVDTTKSFEKIDDAPRVLASIMINYLSPELLGAEQLFAGLTEQKYFNFSLDVADKFLRDKQQHLRVMSMLLAGQLDFSKSHDDIKYRYIYWEWANKLILEKMDFRRFGDLETLTKAILMERIVLAECYKAGKKCNKKFYINLHGKYIGRYLKDLEKSIPGERLLLMYDIRFGNLDLFRTHLNHFLEKNQSQIHEDQIANFDFISFLIELLIEEKQFDEVNKLASSEIINSYDLNQLPVQSTTIFRSLNSILKLHNNDLSEYQQLISENFNNYPCAEWLTTTRIYQMWDTEFQAKNKMPSLIKTISESYGRLEISGLKSFGFYNQWGIIENDAGNFESSYKKYEQALKFKGEHSWALLNWGSVALAHGDFVLAREKYQKSLEIGLVPNAAHGYLRTLWGQGDGEAYLESFEKYSEIIKDAYEYPVRSEFERAAITFSCGLAKPIQTSVLEPKEGILIEGKVIPREEFKKMACTAKVN